jgi:hypothetical protein
MERDLCGSEQGQAPQALLSCNVGNAHSQGVTRILSVMCSPVTCSFFLVGMLLSNVSFISIDSIHYTLA